MKKSGKNGILSGLIIYNQPVRLLSSLAIYIFIVWPLADILWPSLFFITASVLKLHHVFSVDLLNSLIISISCLIFVFGTWIALARCFNDSGSVCAFLKNKDETGRKIIQYPSKKLYIIISCMLYIGLFALLMITTAPKHYFATSLDLSRLLYLELDSLNYISFLKRYCIVFGYSRIFSFVIRLVYFVNFIIGFYLLVPNVYILGTQYYIWKIRRDYIT